MISPQTTLAGLPSTLPPSDAAGDRGAYLRSTFFLHAHRHLREAAAEPARAAAKACLANRGFDLRRLDPLPIGLAPDLPSMRSALVEAGFTAEEIRASGLLRDSRLSGRLVGPIADGAGQIDSFWAWAPAGERPRCLYSDRSWKPRLGLCGMDVRLAGGGGRRRRYPGRRGDSRRAAASLLRHSARRRDRRIGQRDDARPLAAAGHDGRASRHADLRRLSGMGRHNARRHRERRPGQDGTEIYVLPSEKLPAMKNLGETVRSLGVEVLKGLLERDCLHAYRYQALLLLARHKQGVGWTNAARQSALEEARQFYTAADPRNVPQLDAFFVPPIVDELRWEGDGRGFGEMGDGHHLPEQPAVCWAQMAPVPVLEPLPPQEPASAERPAQQPATSAAPPAASEPAPSGPSQSSLCPLHGCDRMKCFCWD